MALRTLFPGLLDGEADPTLPDVPDALGDTYHPGIRTALPGFFIRHPSRAP